LPLRPPAFVTHAAELLTWHRRLAGIGEFRRQRGDIAGDEHAVDVGPGDQEAVHHIGTRRAEGDRCVRRYQHALRRERELLSDSADCYRLVGLKRAPEIALDELAGDMKRPR